MSKGPRAASRPAETTRGAAIGIATLTPVAAVQSTTLPPPAPAPRIEPLSVMGIGSWPRPLWMKRALHDRLEGRLSDDDFHKIADDAVRICVDAQLQMLGVPPPPHVPREQHSERYLTTTYESL